MIAVILVAVAYLVQHAGSASGQHGGITALAVTVGTWVLVLVILPLSQYRAIRAALRRLEAEGGRR